MEVTPEQFEQLIRHAKACGGAASRGIERDRGPVNQDDLEALVRTAGAIAFGRQLSRSFTPEGRALMDRIVETVVERVSLEVDTKCGKAVA